jgi:translation initiation factor 2 subunit 2
VSGDLSYEALLERAYKLLPPRRIRRERLEVEPPEVVTVGKRTFITNFKRICDTLNRDPRLVLRFLLKELGASGNIEGDAAVIYGVAARKIVKDLIDVFVKNYVNCPVCGSPDTILIREERKFMQLRCTACGATTPVKPF